jgi:hypothetical protein
MPCRAGKGAHATMLPRTKSLGARRAHAGTKQVAMPDLTFPGMVSFVFVGVGTARYARLCPPYGTTTMNSC